METSDGEVEFLDEDVDIVQQYVTKPISKKVNQPFLDVIYTARKNNTKKRNKRDYDADEEYIPEVETYRKKPKKEINKKVAVAIKRKEKIIIPDYVDHPFLPAKVTPKNLENVTKTKLWNKFCVEQYMKADNLLCTNPDDEVATTSSVKTLVFRHLKNKITGKIEPMVCGKTKVTYRHGDSKYDDYRCVLPNFCDKKTLQYKVYPRRNTGKMILSQSTVLLSREEHNGSEILVTYKPEERTSVNFKLVDKRNSKNADICNRQLEEHSSYNVCALCYQHSWKKNGYLPHKTKVTCAICNLNFTNTFNMLMHLRTHDKQIIQQKRSLITKSLASLGGNNYMCRICQKIYNTVKELHTHVLTHKGSACFKCSVGNHVTR